MSSNPDIYELLALAAVRAAKDPAVTAKAVLCQGTSFNALGSIIRKRDYMKTSVYCVIRSLIRTKEEVHE